jgi:hypothetical protein
MSEYHTVQPHQDKRVQLVDKDEKLVDTAVMITLSTNKHASKSICQLLLNHVTTYKLNLKSV